MLMSQKRAEFFGGEKMEKAFGGKASVLAAYLALNTPFSSIVVAPNVPLSLVCACPIRTDAL